MALDVRGATTLLQVYDMPASVRFYRDVLGFEMVSHSPHRGGDPGEFRPDRREDPGWRGS